MSAICGRKFSINHSIQLMDLGNAMNRAQGQEPWTDYAGTGYSQSYLSGYFRSAYEHTLWLSNAARYLMENCPYVTTPSLLESLLAREKLLGSSGLPSTDMTAGSSELSQTLPDQPYNTPIGNSRLTETVLPAPREQLGFGWNSLFPPRAAAFVPQKRIYNSQVDREESVQIVKIQEPDSPLPELPRAVSSVRPPLPQKKSSARIRPVGDIAPSVTLTKKERQAKIDLYREKRKRRIFSKKVSYDCRKKVADQRIRIKGRFVTKTQALELLAIPDDELTIDRIKVLLRQRAFVTRLSASDTNFALTNLKQQ